MADAPRIYADTSVYGCVFDAQFARHSRIFFDQVRAGRFQLVASALVAAEVEPAPPEVRELFASLTDLTTTAPLTADSLTLQAAYLAAGIVSERSEDDALHVALATTSACRFLASWNFKHIVHIERAPRYNAVNTLHGFPPVDIHSPSEIIGYEEGL